MNTLPDVLVSVAEQAIAGSHNLATDQECLHRHAMGLSPDTLRFYRSLPTACVGYHQAIDRELRLDYCQKNGIETARRITGGGALYLDEMQQGIGLVIKHPGLGKLRTGQLLEKFSTALAAGLAAIGIPTRYRFPNDLEVAGRKIASVFLAAEGDSFLFQATLLLDANIRAMLEALRVPTEKLSENGLASARDRLITVREYLGGIPASPVIIRALQQAIADEFGLHFIPAATRLEITPTLPDTNFTNRIDWRDEHNREAIWKTSGGVLRARVDFDETTYSIRRVQLAGDVHVLPQNLFERLTGGLTGLTPCMLDGAIHRILHGNHASLAGFTESDLAQVLQLAVEKSRLQHALRIESDSLMLYRPDSSISAQAILESAEVMLVPYCAKPAWCEWRNSEDCPECGLCDVGEAYHLARERNMQVITITHYENLVSTLNIMKESGTRSYVGMCCSNFFIKRHQAFQEAGIPALLMDIAGSNCYELNQESAAYAGQFQAQAELDEPLLQHVMKFVPGPGRSDPVPR